MTSGGVDYDSFCRFVDRHQGKRIELTIEGGAKVLYDPDPVSNRQGKIGFISPDGEESGSLSPRFVKGYTIIDKVDSEAGASDTLLDLKRTGRKGVKEVSESAGSETDGMDSGE